MFTTKSIHTRCINHVTKLLLKSYDYAFRISDEIHFNDIIIKKFIVIKFIINEINDYYHYHLLVEQAVVGRPSSILYLFCPYDGVP